MKFNLPLKGTPEYLEQVGLGSLGDALPTSACKMDGHEVYFDKTFVEQFLFCVIKFVCIFTDASIFFVIDLHLRIQNPTVSQRDYYDGKKAFHCKSHSFSHDGEGRAVYIHGGETGATNDATLLARISFGKNVTRYVAIEDYVICHGAWRNEGAPYLCRFADRTCFTAAEMTFNYILSVNRVVCATFCG